MSGRETAVEEAANSARSLCCRRVSLRTTGTLLLRSRGEHCGRAALRFALLCTCAAEGSWIQEADGVRG